MHGDEIALVEGRCGGKLEEGVRASVGKNVVTALRGERLDDLDAVAEGERRRMKCEAWTLVSNGGREARGERGRERRPDAGRGAQRGPHEKVERDGRRDWIAGQPEDESRSHRREEHGLRRTDRDLMEANRGARGFEGGRNEVVVARRHASGREEDVVATRERGAERLQEGGLRVARDAEVRHLRARAPERANQEGPVRVADLRGARRRAGHDDLVPGHEHCGTHRTRDPDRGTSGGRREDEVGGREAAARG